MYMLVHMDTLRIHSKEIFTSTRKLVCVFVFIFIFRRKSVLALCLAKTHALVHIEVYQEYIRLLRVLITLQENRTSTVCAFPFFGNELREDKLVYSKCWHFVASLPGFLFY